MSAIHRARTGRYSRIKCTWVPGERRGDLDGGSRTVEDIIPQDTRWIDAVSGSGDGLNGGRRLMSDRALK